MARAFLVPPGVNLRSEFDVVNPKRDRTSDGWIADHRHSLIASDHNPRDDGAVLALDVDVDGVPMARIVAFLVARCKAGTETRLQYVIYRRVIWSRSWGWTSRAYHGSNPHTKHAHYSFRVGVDGRRAGAWGVAERFGPQAGKPSKPAASKPSKPSKPGKHAPGSRTLRSGSPAPSGADVVYVQEWLGEAWAGPADGIYGPRTVAAVKRYQRMRGLTADGIVGPDTWRNLGVRYVGT